jgi:hypothetical protein
MTFTGLKMSFGIAVLDNFGDLGEYLVSRFQIFSYVLLLMRETYVTGIGRQKSFLEHKLRVESF